MSATVWIDKSWLPWNRLNKNEKLNLFIPQFHTVVVQRSFAWSEKSYQVKNLKQENKLSYLSLTTFVLLAPQNDELVRMPGEKKRRKEKVYKDLNRFAENNSKNNKKFKTLLSY